MTSDILFLMSSQLVFNLRIYSWRKRRYTMNAFALQMYLPSSIRIGARQFAEVTCK